ncbi:hypothetical protein Pla52o_30470 [Novipirellula galeiformis]|uniref:Uncharacterized protein n=1 Tax=Novipirellula galeiformis TaxID=2528004 RepID=A0A5C6CGZ2_9BACT|nr:hypothetical protein Pla52o_30470 [Novipirellula galeiformis]
MRRHVRREGRGGSHYTNPKRPKHGINTVFNMASFNKASDLIPRHKRGRGSGEVGGYNARERRGRQRPPRQRESVWIVQEADPQNIERRRRSKMRKNQAVCCFFRQIIPVSGTIRIATHQYPHR